MTDESREREATARRARVAKTILTLALAFAGLWIASRLLPALIWAVIVAIAVDPLYLRVARRPLGSRHRIMVAVVLTSAIGLLVIVPLAVGAAQGARELSAVLAWTAQARQTGIPVAPWVSQLPFVGSSAATWWQANLATPEGAQHHLQHLDSHYWLQHSRLIGADVLHRVIIFVLTLLALFFLLRDRDSVVAQCRIASDRLLGDAGQRIVRQTVLSVRGTIDGLVLVGIGEGAVMTIVYLALGVPHALLMGLLTAAAAIVPFGAALMFAVAAALLLVKGAPIAAIAVVVIGLIVVGIADHFVRPTLIGKATRLPFLWVLIGILGGVEMFGLLGLFVGPATMAVLYMLWREFIEGVPHKQPEPLREPDSGGG